jgi:hypothetical protein
VAVERLYGDGHIQGFEVCTVLGEVEDEAQFSKEYVGG